MTHWIGSKWLRLTALSVVALAGVLWACEVDDDDDGSTERTRKSEYTTAQADLGSNIDTVTVPGSATTDLTAAGGSYGFYLGFGPAQSLEVSVLGSASITYIPEYSPGFDFVDTSPGTTVVTNVDTENTNGVLVSLEGSGEVEITVAEGG